jgi:flagellar hook-associated protein 2
LESQDTVISSLGTLFSSLSNDMSSLTDVQGILSEKTGSSSDTNVLSLTAASNSAFAGTHTVEVANLALTSSGYLAPITSASETLSGSVTLQAGSGAPRIITITSADNTLTKLATTINSLGAGVNASVLTDSSGSRLSLVSGTSGADGNFTVSANSIVAADQILGYTGTAGSTGVASTGSLSAVGSSTDTLTGSVSIAVGGGTTETVVLGAVPSSGAAANTIYTGTSVNTLSTLGTTIQSNATSLGFTANVVGTTLSLTSSATGTAGTLSVNSSIVDTGSSSLGYTSAVTGKDANLTVDGINLTSASNTVANLIPGVTFQLLAPSAAGEQVQVVIGNDNTDVESTFKQFVTDYNSLVSAMSTQEGNTSSGTAEPLFGSPTLTLLQQQLMGGINAANPNGTLDSISTSTDTTLAGSMTIQVGSGTMQTIAFGTAADAPATNPANTIYVGSGINTLSGLASAINAADIGVTAGVVTTGGESTLSLISQTAGANGALTVGSSIAATSDTIPGYAGSDATDTENSTGTLTGIASAGDVLTGSVSIQLGGGTAETVVFGSTPASGAAPDTIYTGTSVNTLSTLAATIQSNSTSLGVTASLNPAAIGSQAIGTILTLTSNTSGTDGNLTVTSNMLDTTNTSSTTLNYTNSSDINSLTSLGISVNNDGSISLDTTSLDSVLNSDYSSVAGFFQNVNSWGLTFSNILTNGGSSSPTGILSLASSSNSNIESTLNADISKENTLISAQQVSLTAEMNSANEIMQELPTQIEGVNELYSAITGYNQQTNG